MPNYTSRQETLWEAHRLGRKKYRTWEVLEELRRQQVELTNASAGSMM